MSRFCLLALWLIVLKSTMKSWIASAGPSKNRALLQRGHASCSWWVLQRKHHSRIQEIAGSKGSAAKTHRNCHSTAAKRSFELSVSEGYVCIGYFREIKGNLFIPWVEKKTTCVTVLDLDLWRAGVWCCRQSITLTPPFGFPFVQNMGKVDLRQMKYIM